MQQLPQAPLGKSRSLQRLASRRVSMSQGGFTLMELMAVVVIIGVLSAVAVPSFQRFIIRSREAEAPTNMAAISRGARDYYNREHLNRTTGVVNPPVFPPMSASSNLVSGYAMMPTKVPCQELVGSPRYLSNPARWHLNPSSEPWVNLKFSLATSHYFQYGFKTSGAGKLATFTILAHADMDCDSSLSTFMLSGEVDDTTGEIIMNSIVVTKQGE